MKNQNINLHSGVVNVDDLDYGDYSDIGDYIDL